MATTEATTKYPLGEVTRSHHIAISVADIEASTKWYAEMLGTEVTGAWHPEEVPVKGRFLTVNGFTFEMVEYGGSVSSPTQGADPAQMASVRGPIHMAFTVDDCDASYEELKRRGAEFSWLPTSYSDLNVRCAHFWDLDGNMLELIQDLG
jgi:predicted enzyme related to lactoylglutathione lyase